MCVYVAGHCLRIAPTNHTLTRTVSGVRYRPPYTYIFIDHTHNHTRIFFVSLTYYPCGKSTHTQSHESFFHSRLHQRVQIPPQHVVLLPGAASITRILWTDDGSGLHPPRRQALPRAAGVENLCGRMMGSGVDRLATHEIRGLDERSDQAESISTHIH